ncbi:ATP synthase F1 subunit gamma [Clostridium cellulovorans]|uniref:ATP synthase gamma chain n=1 Tax=Clostridium cellulovorans (strain ATCC 35296 / DSM 3052 / OCM 3 / 743B) TaxID=573061 RepID=D9STK6_CLOC7|nr:ATP synthase F1 subunit gamma [Clostridium cellulovorans]ADL52740.1 ATP synthase F1, gamma subunit [Clostridium cellulovorans 743B]
MAGAGLIEIKRRIKSVKNTRKITSSMSLIATSNLKKARVAMINNKSYGEVLDGIMNQIATDVEESNIYVNGNGGTKTAYIVITSDQGLCGGYNSNVILTLIDKIKDDKENKKVILVGEKGRGYLRRYKFDTLAEYVDLKSIPTMDEAAVIATKALELYKSNEYGEINIVYTKFVSSVKQAVEVKRLLPFNSVQEKKTNRKQINYELTPIEDLEILINSYMNSQVFTALLNGKTSEQSSRMTAMDSATKNADELIEKLNLKYNRIRQAAITQEISEIVGGASAQS